MNLRNLVKYLSIKNYRLQSWGDWLITAEFTHIFHNILNHLQSSTVYTDWTVNYMNKRSLQ